MPNKEWYVFMMGEVTGPFGDNVVTQMLKQNRLQFTDFAWTSGMKTWTRFTEVTAFAELMPPAPNVPVPNVGGDANAEAPTAKVVPMRSQPSPSGATARQATPASHGNAAVAQAPAPAAKAQPKIAPQPSPVATARQAAPQLVENAPAPAATAKAGTRRQWRVPIDATITLQGYGEYKVLDISEGGLLLECRADDKMEIGTDLKLRVSSPSFPKPLDMTGVLVREEEFENKRCYGVEFTKVNPAHKRTLASYVSSKLQLGE